MVTLVLEMAGGLLRIQSSREVDGSITRKLRCSTVPEWCIPIMILKFTTTDILNTALVDARTGFLVYNIITHLVGDEAEAGDSVPPLRKTWIYDSGGNVVGQISWTGRHPKDIIIADENIGSLRHLFGSSTVRFLPKILSIPTRFDSEYVWTATHNSLILLDYVSEKAEAKGRFHYNSIRIGKHMFQTHIPGIGSKYLEFETHPSAHPVELIVSFILMEMIRRGRFSLQPYAFEYPEVRQMHTHESVIRKMMKTVHLDHDVLLSPVLSLLSLLLRTSSSHGHH